MHLLFIFLFTFSSSLTFGNFGALSKEPRIECTIIEILLSQPKFLETSFPTVYDSIFNDNLTSELYVGGKEYSNLNPLRVSPDFSKLGGLRGEFVEKIEIQEKASKIELEIRGKPISSNGPYLSTG